MPNSRWYCLMSAFLGSVRIWISAPSSSSSSVATTGRRPTNSGIRPYLIRSSGSTSFSRLADRPCCSSRLRTSAPKPMPVFSDAAADDLLQPVERAAADEQDVGGVDLDEVLVRVLAPALRRHRGDGAFDQLEQRLLHALARHVARDRRVVATCARSCRSRRCRRCRASPCRRRSRSSASSFWMMFSTSSPT